MKHLLKKNLFLSLGMVIGCSSIIFLSVESNKTSSVEASSYTAGSIPKNLNLNDTSANDIRNYYSSLNSLSTSERQGTNLLKNLKPILKNGQIYHSYGSSATTAVWQIYEIVDRDWVKSPASQISGYNASTGMVTNYQYGSSNSSVGSNPYVHALYINRNVDNQTRAWGNHNQDGWGINQEHTWPKSLGFDNDNQGTGARGDLMHLWAGNGRVNGDTHSNYFYGYVDTSRSYNDAGSYASQLSGNRRGYSRSLGGNTTVFEPQDSDKGDIARAMFYMAARYNYLSGSDSDGIDAGNPNLEIINSLSHSSSFTSSTTVKGQIGVLQDLLEWNRLDPPDEWEIHRNNLCYNNFTNNRNPFIDFPEWAEYIWGTCSNGSYNSASTGYAIPSGDNINEFGNAGDTPKVNSVTVSPANLELDLNGTTTGTLTATVNVSNNAPQTVNWSSSNTSVATVSSSGVVTAKAKGTCTITARSTFNSNKYGTASITVVNSGEPVVNSVTVSPANLELDLNGTTTGTLTATVNVSNNAPQTVNWSSSNTSVATVNSSGVVTAKAKGTCTITATSTFDENKSGTATIKVVNTSPAQEGTYILGWGDATGDEGTYANFEDASGSVEGLFTFTTEKNGTSSAPAYYATTSDLRIYCDKTNGNGGSITISTEEGVTITGVVMRTTTAPAVKYYVDSGSPVSITASSNTYTMNNLQVQHSIKIQNGNTGDNIQLRIKTIEITYETAGVSPAKTLNSISLDTSNVKKNYIVGEEFSLDGLIVTAHYSDESSAVVTPTSVSTPNMSTTGNKNVTVSYTEGEVTKQASYQITISEPTVTSITASVEKSFHPGDTIEAYDIAVTDNLGNDVSDYCEFECDGYEFTYDDAPSGGETVTKTFVNAISYLDMTCSLQVNVSRVARQNVGLVIDTLDRATTGNTGSSYLSWNNKVLSNGITYAGSSAGGNSSIQLRTDADKNGNRPGIVSTQNNNSLDLSNVSVVWNSNTSDGREIQIYGDTEPYSTPNELFGDSIKGAYIGSIKKGTSTSLSISGSYQYIGIRSKTGALYLEEINISYGSSDNATNVANYIMFEDTNNQCQTKFGVAQGYFEGLSDSEKTSFMTSDDYVISTARTRFNAWATHLGKVITTDGDGKYIIQNAKFAKTSPDGQLNLDEDSSLMILFIICTLGAGSLSAFYLVKKKKKN